MMAHDYWRKNIAALEHKNNALAQLLQDYKQQNPQHSEAFSLLPSKENKPYLKYNNRSLQSRYYPVKEATERCQLLVAQGCSSYIVIDPVLSYFIADLHAATSESTSIVILIYDLGLLTTNLMVEDYQSLIQAKNVHYLFNPELFDVFDLIHANLSYNPAISLEPAFQNQPHYQQIFQSLKTIQNNLAVNTATHKQFQNLWFQNILKNTQSSNVYPFDSIKQSCHGMSALILSAGPSLTHILPHLTELRKRFILICVDTTYNILKKQEVVPDFLVSVDAQYWNGRHLDSWDGNTTLLTNATLLPPILRRNQQKNFIAHTGFPLEQYLLQIDANKAVLRSGGSVTTAAYCYALEMGFDAIYFAGMDLSFPFLQTHIKGSFFEERGHWIQRKYAPLEQYSWNYLHNAQLTKRKNNVGSYTLSDERMAVYIHWFEEQLSEKRTPCYNLSPEGIQIKGMPFAPLESLLHQPLLTQQRNTLQQQLAVVAPLQNTSLTTQKAQLRTEILSMFDTLEQLIALFPENGKEMMSDDIIALIEQHEVALARYACNEIVGNFAEPYLEQVNAVHSQETTAQAQQWQRSYQFYKILYEAVNTIKQWL